MQRRASLAVQRSTSTSCFFCVFLCHTRDKLPDAGSPYEGDGGSVDDSVEFVLENFVEANKLWVRMHGQVRGGGGGGVVSRVAIEE